MTTSVGVYEFNPKDLIGHGAFAVVYKGRVKSVSTHKYHYCGSWLFIPDPNFVHPGSWIQILTFYPSRIQGSKGTGSRIRVRNTDKFVTNDSICHLFYPIIT